MKLHLPLAALPPVNASAAGKPGDWAAATGFLYFNLGDGATHNW